MTLSRRTLLLSSALTPIMLGACSQAGGRAGGAAAAYPSKDLSFIVQAAAGGGSDLSSRTLSAQMEEILGRSIVVENRPGAAGSTAFKYVAGQPADGYTIGFSPVEISMLGHRGMGVDPADYDFLGQIMLAPGVISVPADSPLQTFEDFLDAASSSPLSLGNAGAGSIWEILGTAVAQATDVQLTPVPFDGAAPAITAALGGQIDAVASGTGEALTGNTDGTLRTLVICHDERHPKLPDVPTAAELGVDVQVGGWGGIYAPLGLDPEIKSTLADAVRQAAESESFTTTMENAGNLVVYKDPEEFTAYVQSEYERFATLVQG